METERQDIQGQRLSLAEAFAEVPDPRVVNRSKHDLVEMRVVTVCGLLCGVDDFVGIEAWANERIDGLRGFLQLENGAPSHDTLSRWFGLLDRKAVEKSFRRWVGGVLLAAKDNPPILAESITTFFEIGQAEGWRHTPHTYLESVEKDHGRLEVRRCWAFDHLDCLANPQQWSDLKMFGVIEAERTIHGTTRCERRLYIGSSIPDAVALANTVRVGHREPCPLVSLSP